MKKDPMLLQLNNDISEAGKTTLFGQEAEDDRSEESKENEDETDEEPEENALETYEESKENAVSKRLNIVKIYLPIPGA
jgi:sortase (surface protein transpeptidase)